MIYINYLSKIRNKVGMTTEQLQKEIEYNQGRVATKIVSPEQVQPNYNLNKTFTQIQNMITVFNAAHNIDYGYDNMYKTFKIPKRSGGYREICAPEDELKELQHTVMKMVTKGLRFLPHNAAHGFTKKRNCKTSLQVHQAAGSRWFLKLDIKDFFPNTKFGLILTTMNQVYPFCLMPDPIKEMFVTLCTRNGETPQGAPTSPMITNMVMVPNDVAITKYCKEHDLVYTRYADDILISSRVSFDWEQVQQDIQNILQNYELKTEKTRYGSFNGRNWNLGLMYNNKGEITVGHKKKQLVKNMIHNYLTKPAQKTYENWYNLVGTVGYCAYIEPEYFEKYLDIIKANKPA